MSDTAKKMDIDISFRAATDMDGARMYEFVRDHGVLELNTAYAYMILAKHFGAHCLVAECPDVLDEGELAGFILAYRPPANPEQVFVWQIGTHPKLRGQGLARRMLNQLTTLDANKDAEFVTATVATDNEPSRALFRSFARHLDTECTVSDFFKTDMFPSDGSGEHAAEELFRIGPLPKN
ncbi:MAG: diaminobutyrate acetyltransferase [Gammaproteobacteria bacterium]|nr:diaminobutyrate acetyltransferase [Gammaproteobacteria bacterium]